MKNLKICDVSVKDLKISSDGKLCSCYGHNEINGGELYICTYNLCVTSFDENGIKNWRKDLSELASSDNRPVNLTFLSLPNSLCLGLENGELFTISDRGTCCDLVGICEHGLLALEWSPDQELIVLVTKEMNTILMSCMFDPIHEISLLGNDFGQGQFITVGWGRKETQFHGSEGKQARVKDDVTADPHTEADNTVKITWRGDGNLYAIGFTLDCIRRFKVFDREGHLQYTSEKHPGIESNLCWRPSGNVIATTQRQKDKYVIAFFEKNGLKHGGFDIPVNSTTVVEELSWSSDSEIITLQCRDTANHSQKLLLFTMGNYHWYLKQTLVFKEQKISKILWDNDFEVANNKKLHVVLNNGQHYTYTWAWNINHSRGKSDTDDAVVAVIDGKKILITGFRQTVVPPPMGAFEIELNTFVNSIHFAPADLNTNNFFVITSDNKLTIFEQIQKFPLQYKALKTIDVDKYEFPFQYYNWYWLNRDTILCGTINNICNFSIAELNLDLDEIITKNVESLPSSLVSIETHPTETFSAYLQLKNGDIIKYSIGGAMDPIDILLNTQCLKFNVFSIDGEIYIVDLSHKGQLFINNGLILNNVSSFFVHTDFLLLTTLQHMFLCTELSKTGIEAIKEHSKNESTYVYKRKIERGAKLIIAVPNDTRTVFQMPRGNLETIQPRPLSLKIIGKFLDTLKYYEAFDLMRKQRINLNLIYDHDPSKFMDSIKVFLEIIQNNSWLSLFLSDLENVDVTKTMYASSYAEKKDRTLNASINKTQKICELIRSSLSMRSDTDYRILPFLTSFVKTNTVEDLESALSLIKDLKLREADGSKLPVGSDEALKYLLYMVEVNRLFDVALGMYDFDLVLLVATKSQKDPKEYLPMLNEWKKMDESYRRFSINKHLKRFDKAVKCLVECGPEKHEELKTFVKYHSLYNEALSLFSSDTDVFKEISEDFGQYLKLKKQFTEAGIIYERGGNYDKAIQCYRDALEWELAVNLAESWPKDQYKELCLELVNLLRDEKRHREALKLLELFYEDKEEAVTYAIASGQYKSALRLCTQYKKTKYKEHKILPALLEDYINLQEQVETNWTNFVRHKERLSIVREEKNKAPIENFDASYMNKDSDLYSDAGSTLASSKGSSTRSFRSSKNRRKHERKVASLKEGSQYEDVALVMALHTLVTSSFELRTQVKEVNVALCCFGKMKEAFILQTSLDKLLREMKENLKVIWTNELVIEATNASIAALNAPEGVSVVPLGIASLEPHIRISPVIQDISWKLNGLF